ncbi:hypothetical protein Q2453_24815, partial [Escherichia coli]|nr:hypothetical protein [Escherichia coli]
LNIFSYLTIRRFYLFMVLLACAGEKEPGICRYRAGGRGLLFAEYIYLDNRRLEINKCFHYNCRVVSFNWLSGIS